MRKAVALNPMVLAVLAVVVVITSAQAQNPGAVAPAPAAAPAAEKSAAVPAPAAAAPAPAAKAETAAPAAAPAPADKPLESEAALAPLEPSTPVAAATAPVTAASPDEYTIQKGDTLWDISARFFDKPEYWPKLWSYNQYITNPHFIYPNNKVVFKPGSLTEPPSAEVVSPKPVEPLAAGETPAAPGEVAAAPTAPGETPAAPAGTEAPAPGTAAVPQGETAGAVAGTPSVVNSPMVTLREDAYITPARENYLGTIVGSYAETFDLSEFDQVYLKLRDNGNAQVGDLFTVFREEKKVGGLGYLNRVVGVVEVKEINDRQITAQVRRSFYPLERGDKVREYYNAIHEVKIQEASNPVQGKIVERLSSETYDIGSGDVVYIDRGAHDGVEPGYEFLVLRRADRAERTSPKFLPEEIVGRLVVVVARGNNSTAVVTYSNDALHIGDRIATSRNVTKK